MTVHLRDAKLTKLEWCNQGLANKKSPGIHLIMTKRERCNTLLGLYFFFEKGFLTLPQHRTMSQDRKQNNRQAEHTDCQAREMASKAQAPSGISLILPLQSGKHNTRVICPSSGAGVGSQSSAPCQEDRTSFLSSDVLFHQKALSEQIWGVFYPLVPGNPPFHVWLHRLIRSEHGCTSGNLGFIPCAVSPTLPGWDRMKFCITFSSKSV